MNSGRRRRVIEDFLARIEEILSSEFVSLLMLPEGPKEPIRLVIIVERARARVLEAIARELRDWKYRHLATPLVFDRAYLENARDVFPIEFHEMCETAEVVSGEDVFGNLTIDDRNLRYQCEYEVRGKLLRLREYYLERAGKKKLLRELLTDSVTTFATIMRSFLRLDGGTPPKEAGPVFDEIESRHTLSLATFRKVARIRDGAESWPATSPDDLFASYLEEAQAFVAIVDRYYRDAGS